MKTKTSPKMTVKQKRSNGWRFLIRYKEGSIPSVAEEYRSICSFCGSDSLDRTIAEAYPRKGKANKKLHMDFRSIYISKYVL